MKRLDGKIAVISGGAQGIGQACAKRLADEGAVVIIGDLQDNDVTAKEITAAGGVARHVVMDTRKRADWSRLVAHAVDEFGRLDLLGNVAGVVNLHSPDNVVDLTDEGWDSVIDTDLKGVWLGMQAAIPAMKAGGGGSIVNISSLAAVNGLVNLASYSAAKGGVLALTRQVAQDFGADGIRVNAICPGTIDTPILADITDEMRTLFADKHIIKRLGRPEDIAAMMAFLMSDDADFVTGQSINSDGGWSIN